MSDPLLRLSAPRPVARRARSALPVGRQLVSAGLISTTTLLQALATQRRIDAPLGEILVAEGHVARADVMTALAVQHDTDHIDMNVDRPNPAMARALPAALCQQFGVVPWRWIGATLLVATARPDQMQALAAALPDVPPRMLPVIADRDQIIQQIGLLYGHGLAHRAVTRLPAAQSCRTWSRRPRHRTVQAVGIMTALLALAAVFPAWAVTVLIGWAVLTLAMTTTLKALALAAQISHRVPARAEPLRLLPYERLPRISVMVPLFKEHRIAEALVSRLSKLTYPKALLDVVLVLESRDDVTRATLARTDLPSWMRVIEVPDDGTITTKPRALKLCLGFLRRRHHRRLGRRGRARSGSVGKSRQPLFPCGSECGLPAGDSGLLQSAPELAVTLFYH
jgi:hypothetical protein